MVSVLALHVINCVFYPCHVKPEEYKISICCISAKHTVLMCKSKDWFATSQDNVIGQHVYMWMVVLVS